MYIDTHAHLQFEQFDLDREKVIQSAIQNKINGIITVGTDLASSRKAVALAEKFAIIYSAVGIHPNDCENSDEFLLKQIEEMATYRKSVAIGEIGLDYYRMVSSKEKQHRFFRMQIQLAKKLQLPLIIHNRDAQKDIYDILCEEGAKKIRGVLHSFSGDFKFMEAILDLNFYISFTGSVTFKNANYYKLINNVPLKQLILETDSPFLAPVPFRGKRNEPAYIKYIAEKIAKIKNLSVLELGEITTENAHNLFHFQH